MEVKTETLNIKEIRKQLRDYWKGISFELFVTLTIKDDRVSHDDLAQKVLKWARQVQYKDHVQIGYMGLISSYPRLHVHLLALAKDRRGRTGKDCDTKLWEWLWIHGRAEVKTIKDPDAAATYLAFDNTPVNSFSIVTPYNTRLLKKAMKTAKTALETPKKGLYIPKTPFEMPIKGYFLH